MKSTNPIIGLFMRVEGFAIISEDGMLADTNGQMPSALVTRWIKNICLMHSTLTCSFTAETRMRVSPNPPADDG